ncbi:MAG: hypothetical protein UT34_C0002G0004 [candidate division WS6 bacterium GW2011_GWF2_39_15]|uniref:Uncharacterized protein n=1 Tax=candidate division WS6 bacterium GW2011_GWF2_39_15 TaxID=1619100 RepID=A0A0G0QV21_9BACT|nr:MAG: hypothetical protein UT34_C0002G0004 [candidate division WS6 bacterium GW2011_GWF2_39_15]
MIMVCWGRSFRIHGIAGLLLPVHNIATMRLKNTESLRVFGCRLLDWAGAILILPWELTTPFYDLLFLLF